MAAITQPRKMQVATSEVVRDINKRVVLNLIRTRQPLSRADLARISGLQRSTISLIVEELLEDRWVLEGPTGRLPRGRRPTFLRLNDERVIIGVDIRPTQITVALADVNGKFASQEVMPTPADPKSAVSAMIARIQRLLDSCRGKKVEGIGISLPGRVERISERLVFAPNLKWPEFDIREPIATATGLEVELENAANACVLAAVWFDHVESRNMVVVTVSEGIGTGILVNGRLARGLSGMAGEFGHVPLDPNGPVCSCGSRGCWEVFASNRAALRYYFESSAQAPGLTFPDLLSLADQGDGRAAQALEKMAQYLGRGMRMIVAGLDPEQILVVGDLTHAWPRFGPVIQAEVQAQVLPGAALPRLVPVHGHGMARLRGTIALVLQKHFAGVSEAAA
ncbi:MAG: ROK family transcriptional regulator [Acidobacteriia bacterium]|nr:ROK family transcriptional regulator [Terriglobia bacterium]